MSSDAFTVTKDGETGMSIVHMSMSKSEFNPEIARFLYDHGKDVFRQIKQANYSDVTDTLQRRMVTKDPNNAIKFLITDTAMIIDKAIQKQRELRSDNQLFRVSGEAREANSNRFISRIREGARSIGIDMQ